MRKRENLGAVGAVGAVLLALASTVHAASFDCAKALSKVEKMICADAELSKLDAAMADAYKDSPIDRTQRKRWQAEWLRERNTCADADCVKRMYETRIFILRRHIDKDGKTLAVADALAARGWDYVLRKGKGGTEDWLEHADDPMCRQIKEYMNLVAPDWHLDDGVVNRCARAVRSAPIFSEPPWEELDPQQYEQLIARLMRFGSNPAGYFKSNSSSAGFDQDYFHKKANEFIAAGGRLQHWKGRLKESFSFPADGNDKPAPPGLQDVIQLRYSVRNQVGPESGRPPCPLPDWDGSVFLVTPELTGPLRYLDGLSSKSLLLYQGDPVLDSSGGYEVSVKSPHGAAANHQCRLINPKAHNQGM